MQVDAVIADGEVTVPTGFETGVWAAHWGEGETAKTAGQTERRRTGIEPACQLSPTHRF
jgi:hypothetical protein